MKASKFTESQIVACIKKHEGGMSVEELSRSYGVSTQTIYNWKAKYGGLSVSELTRLRELEKEISNYKKLVGELSYENKMMKDLIEKKL